MNKEDFKHFYDNCPSLYHMAQPGSWELIQKLGLLSTNRLIEEFGLSSTEKLALTTKRRPDSVPISHELLGTAVVRDQIPLLDSDLEKCLLDGLTPQDWHKRLNERVFFWTSEERLHRLTGASAYRDMEHDVLTLDTRKIFESFFGDIELSPMNSGCTRPWRHRRGTSTFLPIGEYPYSDWRKKKKKFDVITEVTILGGIEDVMPYVSQVRRMNKAETLEVLYSR